MSHVIEKNIARSAHRKIEFICRQLIRFQKMPFDERMSYMRKHPTEYFCRIPHHEGDGYLHCGILGWNKFSDIANLVLDLDLRLAQRVGNEQARDAVISAFVRRILHEALEVVEETAALILEDVLEALKRSLVVTEHYVPCIFFDNQGPDEFHVGPVRFIRRKSFFREQKSVLRGSVKAESAAHYAAVMAAVSRGFPRDRAYDEAGSRQSVRNLYAGAIRTYRDYPWIACVKVMDCDEKASQDLAISATETALHVARVILGEPSTRHVRHAWARRDNLKTAQLYSDAAGIVRASIEVRFASPGDSKQWYEALTRLQRDVDVLGSAIYSVVDPAKTSHLGQRLLDAINWFGDAATDLNASSRLVKYVSAIERLFFGAFESKRTTSFARRVASVFGAFGYDDKSCIQQQALAVYRVRSKLVHGEPFRTRQEALEAAGTAEALSRFSLLCAAQLYPMIAKAFDRPGPAKLEEAMRRVTEQGLDWLLDSMNIEG